MGKINKNNKDNVKGQTRDDEINSQDNQTNTFQNVVVKDLNTKVFAGLVTVLILLIVIIVIMIMGVVPPSKWVQVLLGVTFICLMGFGALINIIRKTIGVKFIITLYRAFKMKSKGYGLVKEFKLSGMPQYHLVKFDDIITYKTKANNKDKIGMLIYHPYAKYEDFGGHIPIIEGSLSDISPKNFFTGNRIGMNPDLTDKIIVESAITPKELDDVKKQRKMLLWGVAIILIAVVIGFDLYSQRLTELNNQIVACYKDAGKTSIINAALLLWGRIKYDKQ